MKKYFPVLLIITLIFVGCNKETVDPISEKQWEVFSYFPANTQILIYFNPDNLKETSFWNDLFKNSIEKNEINSWLSDFQSKTGVGLESGVSEIYIATTWEGNNSVAVVFNRNREQVKKYFQSDDYKNEKIKNKTIYIQKDNPISSFYFPDDSTLLILNNTNYAEKVIDESNYPLSRNKKFIDIVENIKYKDQYWMATARGDIAVALIEQLMKAYKDLPGKEILKSIQSITLSAEFSDGVTIESNLGCNNSANATLLSTAINGAIAMDIFSRESKVIGEIMSKTDVDSDYKIVSLEVSLDDEEIVELRQFAKKNKIDKKL